MCCLRATDYIIYHDETFVIVIHHSCTVVYMLLVMHCLCVRDYILIS